MKHKYPEYINGVKQAQNPICRFFIKLWYSDWFRVLFVIFPIWLFALMTFCVINFPFFRQDKAEFIFIGIYAVIFCLALNFNDYSNLRKIGLDEYHCPLKEEADYAEQTMLNRDDVLCSIENAPSIEAVSVRKREETKPEIAGMHPEIFVSGTKDKPCFQIKYFDTKDKTIHIGFGSYCLDYVFDWLKEYFGSERAHINDQDGLNEARDLYATQVENEIKTEAIKEFADKLKENIADCHTVSDGEYVGYDWTDIADCIDNLVKEVVGDTE